LTCLGFQFQSSAVSKSNYEIYTDSSKKAFTIFPDIRYIDLNLRMSHVMSSLQELCFDSNEASLNPDFIRLISSIHSILPIEDPKLLSCIIDVLVLTKFSPEILLSVSDFSVNYAFTYNDEYKLNRENLDTRSSNRKIYSTIQNNLNTESTLSLRIDRLNQHRIDFNNKIINFLFSIGFEVIGSWLRFQDIQQNRKLLENILKLLSSFSTDRDMTLYKDLNFDVLGQDTIEFHNLLENRAYSFGPVIMPNSHFSIVKNWSILPETQNEVLNKMNFINNLREIQKRQKIQRKDILNHHLSFYKAQANDENKKLLKENFKTHDAKNGSSLKDRRINNEPKIETPIDVEKMREYSHYLRTKRLIKVENEFNETIEKLVLPYISTTFK